MLLQDHERRELAEFFAKRSETLNGEQCRLAVGLVITTAHVGAGADYWEALLEQAESRKKLPLFATVIARSNPKDENLQSVCRLLMGRRRRAQVASAIMGGAGLGFLGAGAVGMVAGIVGLFLSATPTPSVASTSLLTTTAAEVEVATTSIEDVNEDAPPTPLAQVDPPRDVSHSIVLSAAKTVEQARQRMHIDSSKGTTETARKKGSSRCRTSEDGFIGYFHWGPVTDGVPNDEVEIRRSVNVRSEYPQSSNGYNLKSNVRCVLSKGAKVRLSGAPIHVAGGHFWIPLSEGDLQKG